MKKILLATVAAFVAAPALAADLPRRAPAAAPVYAAPVFTWTGFYVGAQVGYGWGKHKIVGAPLALDTNGVVGGVHAGYNWQSGALVYGVEGDLEYGKISEKDLEGLIEASTKTRGSVRVRIGYSFDRVLLYTTGGVAIAKHEWRSIDPQAPGSISKTRTGWTLGVGAEYAFTNNWSARLEYRYSDLGRTTFDEAKIKVTDHVVRVGLSYRFGGPAGPILARY